MASYPLLSQAPTPVEVELGCDNLSAASEEVLEVCHIPPIHLIPQTDKTCCQNIFNQVFPMSYESPILQSYSLLSPISSHLYPVSCHLYPVLYPLSRFLCPVSSNLCPISCDAWVKYFHSLGNVYKIFHKGPNVE